MRVIVCMCMLHVNNPYDVKNSFDLINVKENSEFFTKKIFKKTFKLPSPNNFTDEMARRPRY